MLKSKKILSLLMAIALVVNIFALIAVAAPGDPDALDAKVELVAGRYNTTTKVFTPLVIGETVAANENIAVRIIPTSNYLVGASNYVVMFDKTLFSVMGSNSAAFTVNTDKANIQQNDETMEYELLPGYKGNYYYDFACTNFTGLTTIPDENWPASFAAGERYDVYKAIVARTQTGLSSYNGGNPEVLPGEWLFQFRLKAVSDLVIGTNARIWTDARWFKSGNNPGVEGSIPKCLTGQLSASANSDYNFNFNFNDADIRLPLSIPVPKSTITFNTAGGNAINPSRGEVGSPVIAPQAPTRTGYKFVRWEPEIPAVYPANDLAVTAVWELKKSTISFNSNGGSTVDPITGDYGTSVTAPSAPIRDGYNFAGWQPVIPQTFPESNLTLTAQWTLKQITVTFDSNGGSAVAPKTGNFGTTLLPPASPFRSGYEFVAWSPDLPSTYPANDLTVTAVWAKRITISFNSQGGSPVESITGNEGTPVTQPDEPTRTGYTFAGWSPQLPSVFPGEDLAVNATWTLKQTTIFFNSNGGTEVAPITGDFGTPVTPPSDPEKPGYNFAGWGPAVPAAFPAENITLEAQWVAIEYYVDILYNGEVIEDSLKIAVPWTTMYSAMKIKLDYATNFENAARVEYSSSTFNMLIDQQGNIKNKGFLVRSSKITVNVYDAEDNIIATNTVNVLFYKTILEVVMTKLQVLIEKIVSLFKK